MGERVTGLDFGDENVTLPPEEAVLLAVPPWEAARLLPQLPGVPYNVRELLAPPAASAMAGPPCATSPAM
jgi:hypothetical protein